MPGMQMGNQMHTPASDLRAALVTSWNSADVDRLAGLYGESAVIILPDGSLVTGRQSIREFLQRELANGARLTLTSIGFESSPELQVDFGVFTKSNVKREETKQSTSSASEHGSQAEGKYLMVVRRTGSEWKIQEMAFSAAGKSFD
jgi:ketosteroid isomerase-like protein